MLAPVNLEVEAPVPEGIAGPPVPPVYETALKIPVDVAEVVNDVAGDLAIGRVRIWIEDFPIESAHSEKICQLSQAWQRCVDDCAWLGLSLGFPRTSAIVEQEGSVGELKGTRICAREQLMDLVELRSRRPRGDVLNGLAEGGRDRREVRKRGMGEMLGAHESRLAVWLTSWH